MLTDDDVDDETLAAFIDGALPAAERARVVRALAAEPDLYARFLEAARTADGAREAAPVTLNGQTRQSARRRPQLFAVPILAAAGIAALLWFPRNQRAADTIALIQPAAHAAAGRGSIGSGMQPGWDEPGWGVTRGETTAPAVDAAAARVGARMVQLEFAAAANDTNAVQRITPAILALISSFDGAGPVGEQLRGTVAATSADRAVITRQLRTLSDASAAFDVGAWLELARLSAAARRSEFFASNADARVALKNAVAALERDGASQRWSEVLAHLKSLDRAVAVDLLMIRLQIDSAFAAFPNQ